MWQNSDGSSLSNSRLINLPFTDDNVTSVSVGLLVIGAMRRDTGIYRCSVNSSIGNFTRNVTMIIQCKHVCITITNFKMSRSMLVMLVQKFGHHFWSFPTTVLNSYYCVN